MKEELTMKEKVLRFVESKGSATYTEIIQFIVDTKFGKGTYDKGKGKDTTWGKMRAGDSELPKVKVNIWRGYYAGAFSGPHPYFLKGKDRLVKSEGKYIVNRLKK